MLKVILGSILSGIKTIITQISLIIIGILYLVLILSDGIELEGTPFKILGYLIMLGWVASFIKAIKIKKGERK